MAFLAPVAGAVGRPLVGRVGGALLGNTLGGMLGGGGGGGQQQGMTPAQSQQTVNQALSPMQFGPHGR